jgi:hypothetical protein
MLDVTDAVSQFARKHPKAFLAASGVIIGYSLFQLFEAVDFYHQARQLADELERQASESLGG